MDDHPSGVQAQEGIGLPAIRALAARTSLGETRGGGMEMRMEFAIALGAGAALAQTAGSAVEKARAEDGAAKDAPAKMLRPPEKHVDTTLLRIAPVWLAHAVLPRALSVLAADAHFSVDRISDAQLVADAIAAHADEGEGNDGASYLHMAVRMKPRDLELQIGPLGVGATERVGSALGRLADRRAVAADEEGETLTLGLVDQHRAAK
jgi:hypothetical protein